MWHLRFIRNRGFGFWNLPFEIWDFCPAFCFLPTPDLFPVPYSLFPPCYTDYHCGSGEVSEWLKEHAWKACSREIVTWVRIPPSPPTYLFHFQLVRITLFFVYL